MTELDPIYAAHVPDWPGIYVIGSFDSRITFFSQQVRGFNLAVSLASGDALKGKSRFAIIGAGAAGLSAASALRLLLPNSHVDVYEREDVPLHLQRNSQHRNLHPHIYDWPRPGAQEPEAELPYLDWTAASAAEVAESVVRQFRILQAHFNESLSVTYSAEVSKIERIGRDSHRVSYHPASGGDTSNKDYHAVFLAIGFGRERPLENAPWNAYWSDRGVPGRPIYAEGITTVLVSGSGDGGLIDLCAAAISDFDHSQLISLLVEWPGIGVIAAELVSIDEEAAAAGPDFDFKAAYDRNIGPTLDHGGLTLEISRRLHERVRLVFHTRGANVLEPATAILNRLLVYLLFKAAENVGSPIRHLVGEITAATINSYDIGGIHVTADEVFIRHGTLRNRAFSKFDDVRKSYEESHRRWMDADAGNNIPPCLNPGVYQAIANALAIADIPVSRRAHNAIVASQPKRVRIGIDGAGSIVWGGDIRPDNLIAWWGTPQDTLIVQCAVRPNQLGPLSEAFVRFVMHAHQIRVETCFSEWGTILSDLTQRSPHATGFRTPIAAHSVCAALASTPVDSVMLAGQLNDAMDSWTLREVNEYLTEFLNTGVERANWITWKIEDSLRLRMRDGWRRWHARLAANRTLLARALRLMVCTVEDDTGQLIDRQVLVGPQMAQQLVRAITLALVTAEVWPKSWPRESIPGNFQQVDDAGLILETIHATGADLIDGRGLQVMAAQHSWQTTVVLLSELNAPVDFDMTSQQSLLEFDTHSLRLDAPATPRILIIGADARMERALAEGVAAVESRLSAAKVELAMRWEQQIEAAGNE